MEKILTIILFIIVMVLSGYSIRRNFKKAIKSQNEEYIKEKSATPKQKVETNIQQDQKHKMFIYITLVCILLMFFFKNTFIGYFVGFGCLFLMGKNSGELGKRWSKKQPYNPKILVISFLLMLTALALIAILYYPQLQFMYQDRVK